MSRARILAAAILVAALMLAFPGHALADAVGPVVTGVSPATGTAVPGPFTLEFVAQDTDGIPGLSAAEVVIDGVTYSPSSVVQGYWVWDPYEDWWQDDPNYGAFTFSIPALATQGLHTVEIRVVDGLGNLSTTWSSVIKTAPVTFGVQHPQANRSYVGPSHVEVVAFGPVDPLSVVIEVDGTPVPSSYESLGGALGRIFTTTPISGIGAHTVEVSAGDSVVGTPASTQWDFTIVSSPAGPTIGTPTPGDGDIVQGPFSLTVHASSAQGVRPDLSRLIIDGVPYGPPSAVYPGSWEPDIDGELFWVSDTTQADLSFSVPDLSHGVHQATLNVGSGANVYSALDFQISRGAPITFSQRTPAPESRTGAVSDVSVLLSGDVVPATVTMELDGTPVSASVTASGTDILVSYAGAIGQGEHQVRVEAEDSLGGVPARDDWSFVVDPAAPTIVSVAPMDGSTVSNALAGLSATLMDLDTVDASSVVMYLDGGLLGSVDVGTSAPILTATWAGTLPEGAHIARVEARDLTGNLLSHEWDFTVADPPRFGLVSPSPATTIGSSVLYSVPVSDVNSDLDVGSRFATLDGASVPCTLTLSDARTGTLSVALSDLTEGSHAVVLGVSDSAGNPGSVSFGFTADVSGPALQSGTQLPASGATVSTHAPVISASFFDADGVNPGATAAWLDDVPIAVESAYRLIYDPYDEESFWPDTQVLDVSLSQDLHDGPHTFKVEVFDALGNSAVREWAFTVAEKPLIASIAPTDGSTVLDRSVPIAATITDFDGIVPATVAVRWRRANVFEAPGGWNVLGTDFDTQSGALQALFEAPVSEMRYEIELSAADANGSSSSTTIDIYIGTQDTTLEAPSDCLSCHSTKLTDHAVDDCAACHGDPAGPCVSSCHFHSFGGHGPEALDGWEYYQHEETPETGRTCVDCHFHDSQTEAQRHATTSAQGCGDCHARALTTAHAQVEPDAGGEFDCGTCHESEDPAVTSAISNGDTACEACHDISSAGHVSLHDGGAILEACNECHEDNISVEHADECALCHDSESLAVQAAIAAGDVQCGACHPSYHQALDSEAYNPFYPGYISWGWVETATSEQGVPHGDYATTTNKCQVCHAVHRARSGGVVLSAVPKAGSGSLTPDQPCGFCHGEDGAFSVVTVAAPSDGSIDLHGACTVCHAASPHGTGSSAFPVLGASLLNTRADASLAADIVAGRNGLTAEMFETSSTVAALGRTLAVGYLCQSCHEFGDSGHHRAFAVNVAGATPGSSSPDGLTGHRVGADATDDWNASGSFGASYTGRIAFGDADTCEACHDAKRANGRPAFPHGYVDANGAYASQEATDSSWLWLTLAQDAESTRTIAGQPQASSGGVKDGACLKCHRSGAENAGVGLTY